MGKKDLGCPLVVGESRFFSFCSFTIAGGLVWRVTRTAQRVCTVAHDQASARHHRQRRRIGSELHQRGDEGLDTTMDITTEQESGVRFSTLISLRPGQKLTFSLGV